jgi:ABC-2 type transport system ATP-binding protein
MLDVADITRDYGRHRVLDAVTFRARGGALTGLLGPNGAGKSTLLHIVTGLLAPTSGTVLVDGAPNGTVAARRSLGFCPDDLPQPELLTGREYLDLVQGIRGLRVGDDVLHLLCTGMRLDGAIDRLIASYSHGMKRKLQLVAAVLHRPRVLVLDEPFRGLDPESSAIMKRLLRSYAAGGAAVIVSTHDLLVAEQLCDDVVVLRDGRVVLAGAVDELRGAGDRTLEERFLTATGLDTASEESAAIFFEGLAGIPAGGR